MLIAAFDDLSTAASGTVVLCSAPPVFQTGADAGDTVSVQVGVGTANDFWITQTLTPMNLTSRAIKPSIARIDEALAEVASKRAQLGAEQRS